MSFAKLFSAFLAALLIAAAIVGYAIHMTRVSDEWKRRHDQITLTLNEVVAREQALGSEIGAAPPGASIGELQAHIEHLNRISIELAELQKQHKDAVGALIENLGAKPYFSLNEEERREFKLASEPLHPPDKKPLPPQDAANSNSTHQTIHLVEALRLNDRETLNPGAAVELVKRDGDILTIEYAGAQYAVPKSKTDLR